jgi:hypothetical protein
MEIIEAFEIDLQFYPFPKKALYFVEKYPTTMDFPSKGL